MNRKTSKSGGEGKGWLAVAWLLATGVWGPATSTASPALPHLPRVMVAEPAKPIADFELTGTDGQAVRFSTLQGRPALVFFGFTHCPAVCPAALGKLRMLHAQGKDLEQARVVFVSVDGERDTPEVMKTYLARLSPEFVGMTGESETVREIASRFAAVFFKEPPGPDGKGYLIQHSSQVYLVDAAGNVRAEFYDAPVETMATVTRAVLGEQS
jgi:protein SCO1